MKYYQHHIGDFDKATRHLTRTERSVYRDLIELYYDTEQPLTLNLAAICRKIIARSNEESTAVEQVLNEFFYETTEGWRHERCDEEIESYRGNSTQKALAGKASAAARAAKRLELANTRSTPVEPPLNEREANVQQTINHEPLTINQEPVTIKNTVPDKPAKRATKKVTMPDDFAVSQRVRDWATENNFKQDRVANNFAKFVLWAKSKGAEYADWDAALMNAIRADWAAKDGATAKPFLTNAQRVAAANEASGEQWLAEMRGHQPDALEGEFSHA